jgi:hypothetical protein
VSFTDKDLQRLKEIRAKYDYMPETAWDVNELRDLMDACIARLEAAEKVVECALDCHDMSSELAIVKVWRKAAGK